MPADAHRPLPNRRDSLLPTDEPGEVSRTTAGLWEQGKNRAKILKSDEEKMSNIC